MLTAVTGIQPTGVPHLGNYLGMYRPALELARDHHAFYFVADYHAMTGATSADLRRELGYRVAATALALGLDTSRAALYRQSDLPEVCELAWILGCVTPRGFSTGLTLTRPLGTTTSQRGAIPMQESTSASTPTRFSWRPTSCCWAPTSSL